MLPSPRWYHSFTRTRRLLHCAAFAVAGLWWIAGCSLLLAQARTSIPEETEWIWEVRPSHPAPQLPNILLLGDSITRNYFPQVTKDFDGIANVYLMASSASVGDPRLPTQIAEFSAMEQVPFRIVHFNNGMHGWSYSEVQFQSAFPAFLSALHAVSGHGKLIWATITPIKPPAANGATNTRIDARNTIAKALVAAEKIPIDDQHALVSGHPDLYQDTVHFHQAGSQLMGDQVAATIKQALQSPAN
jgi:hypothetical protein